MKNWYFLVAVLAWSNSGQAAPEEVPATFKQYCFQCHGKAAVGGVNLEQLTANLQLGENFQQWEKVAAALEHKRMPPPKMKQPDDTDRGHAVAWIRGKLREYAEKNAGDPGRVTVRRLTSGEYAYTIKDLTGLDLKLDLDASGDAVGGEGFTNYGDVQFMQDSNLERYLESAKSVAAHAVIGAGPLTFFEDAGKSGFELSAISRIQEIYTTYGFRAVAGEGGKPYGLDRYSKAFYAAWRYHHRKATGEPTLTLAKLAKSEGITLKFLEHIYSVLLQPSATYPTSEVVAKWRAIPAAKKDFSEAAVRTGALDMQKFVIDWPRWLFNAGELAAGGQGDERALVLTDESLKASPTHKFRHFIRGRSKSGKFYFSLQPANPSAGNSALVVWKNGTIRFRKADRSPGPEQTLREAVTEETAKQLAFGTRPDSGAIGAQDFATSGNTSFAVDIKMPDGQAAIEIQIEAELVAGQAEGAVIRATISDTDGLSKGRPVSTLLADSATPGFKTWKANVLNFAANLPQTSHGEPTPSDKDPIPPPFNTTYNQPERDFYHVKLKYYRTDKFLTEKMLDATTRQKLEEAWADLYTSFEYHDIFARFAADKLKFDLKGKRVGEMDRAFLDSLPAEGRKYIEPLQVEYLAAKKAQQASRAGHIEDTLKFATKAWRRPLTEAEKLRLRSFYSKTLSTEQDHQKAVRAMLARVLVAPAFLYRLEQPTTQSGVQPLTDWELANRLSYFIWSSMPDDTLRKAATAGQLKTPAQLEAQVKRMLADPKARRFSSEFFGQWLGFYRFDQYRGVDTSRFPEFTDEVKSAMYDEAVSFFEHVVRKDRPVGELFAADYTFLNQALAKHYGIKKDLKSGEIEKMDGANAFQRGGMMRLGAVLTVTSAPLRTSPVKRGDWLLRRVLGTPTPPPPADAGSIPADDKAFGGLSVFDRLEAHKRNPTCASCHVRIDPLGFPLERYDAVGRWRDTYADGKPIKDSSALADKTPIAGVDGLLDYLKTQESQVLRTFSGKLLGYALGRTVLVSDQPLIDKLTKDGANTNFSKLIAEVVSSKQFRYRRDPTGPPGEKSSSVGKSEREGGL